MHSLYLNSSSPSLSNYIFLETYPSHWNSLSGYYPNHADYNPTPVFQTLTREDKKYLKTHLLPYLDGIESIQQTNHCCYPIRDNSGGLNWRTNILNEYLDEVEELKDLQSGSETVIKDAKKSNNLERMKYEAISVIPTRDLLKDAHFMHKCDSSLPFQKWDCTHYCYFPTMFQAMWATFETIIRTGCVGRECQIGQVGQIGG
jgi:hypothetical protein